MILYDLLKQHFCQRLQFVKITTETIYDLLKTILLEALFCQRASVWSLSTILVIGIPLGRSIQIEKDYHKRQGAYIQAKSRQRQRSKISTFRRPAGYRIVKDCCSLKVCLVYLYAMTRAPARPTTANWKGPGPSKHTLGHNIDMCINMIYLRFVKNMFVRGSNLSK